MDLIQMTRELGKAIQEDERYIKFHKAREANEADKELTDLINQIQLVHMSYQHEAEKEDADESKLNEYEKEFQGLYSKAKANPNMQRYEAAMNEIDALMKNITGILSCCAMGEDADTCEPEHGCTGSCDSCSGCH
ncbi:MAG: YlbF family regulator [Clostridiales bacterium]|jgi:cell fate (sporulation/competence/biofilm development) regulator YlbF (YheA/YmcA/DUF963 family)|nr:YlbF family regulator [Clostridiales bacterium]